jgi:precorrin-6x reductase
MTAAKLQVARELAVQVVVVERPPLSPGSVVVTTVAEALSWVGPLDQVSDG